MVAQLADEDFDVAKGKDYLSVRLPMDVVRMARTLASVDDEMTIAGLIADVCRPVLRSMLEKAIKEGKFLPEGETEKRKKR